jgi:N-acetylmuramoyl-L-alanine amidase
VSGAIASGFAPDHPGARVRPSPNFGPRRDGLHPEIILLHYTGMATGPAAEDRLCDPSSEVSSHYLVYEDGDLVQMVPEAGRAWHAGQSVWRGETDINSRSIGIEIVNPGHALGYRKFPRRQVAAVIDLCRGIAGRWGIAPEAVLGHSDVAPGRKVDPGELFPWATLHRAGIGHFVAPARHRTGPDLREGDCGPQVAALRAMLADYGYGVAPEGAYDVALKAAVHAFQQHFRPARADGVADRATCETLRRLIAGLPPVGDR